MWTEARFVQTPNGQVWTPAGNDYEFWTRYLEVFDQVQVVARALSIQSVNPHWSRVDGDGVLLSPLPYYQGPRSLVRAYPSVRRRSLNLTNGAGTAFLFRLPSFVAAPAIHALRKDGRPYFVELVGDPRDAFSGRASDSPLRHIVRRHAVRALKLQVRGATGVSYVTESSLQAKYPPSATAIQRHYSDVMASSAYSSEHRQYADGLGSPIRISTIASLEQPYKGIDVLIDAVALLDQRGIPTDVTVIGDGRLRQSLENRAQQAGLGSAFRFAGWVHDRHRIIELLDESALFVLPSRAEGLPRSLIEAMARGLICLATNVGGVPELLEPHQMVPVDDSAALASAIESRSRAKDALVMESRRNREKALEYSESRLGPRRREFYRTIAATHEARA